MRSTHLVVTILILVAAGLLMVVFFPTAPDQTTLQVNAPEIPTPSSPSSEPTAVPVTMDQIVTQTPIEHPLLAGYVIDTSGLPMPGLSVELSDTESVAESGEDGRYEFTTVEGETAALRVNHPPYLPVTLKGIHVPTQSAIFVLCREGRISGTVTNILSRPMPGVGIEAIRAPGPPFLYSSVVKAAAAASKPESPWRSVLEELDPGSIDSVCFPDPFENRLTITQEDGRYLLGGLPPGTYTVRASHDSLVAKPHEKISVPLEGTVDGVDFRLGVGYCIRGRAYEERSGDAVADVTITHQITGVKTETKPDGTYDLGPLPPGSYRLTVQPPPGFIIADPSLGPAGPEVNVTDRHVEGIDIKLQRAGSLSGRVVDSASNPVSNARVSLGLQTINPLDVGRMGQLGRLGFGQKTDAQGAFRLDGVPEGRGYVLRAGAENYAPGQYGPFDLDYGESKEDIEITLTQGGAISGRILDASGNPVPDYHAFCLPGDSFIAAMLMMSNENLRRSAVTDQDGRYQLKDVSAGKNFVVVSHQTQPTGGMPKYQRVVDVPARQELSGVDFTVTVPNLGGTISGHVTTSKGEPAPNILVMAMGKNMMMGMGNQEGSQSVTQTDKDGFYTLKDLSENTEYTVLASDEAGRGGGGNPLLNAVTQSVKTSAEDVDFILPGRGGISGRVVYKLTNRPVQAFQLSAIRDPGKDNPLAALSGMLQGMFGGSQGEDFTSSDGTFALSDLLAGRYTLEVTGEGFTKTTRENVQIVEDQTTTDIVIEVEGGAGIEGIVRDGETKTPVDGAVVTVQPGGLGNMLSLMGMGAPQADAVRVMTGADGKFSIAGLDEGRVSLKVTHENYSPQNVGPISVLSTGMQAVEVDLWKGGRIEGHVYGPDGQPVRGMQLSIFATDGSASFRVTTDSEGSYSKELVPEGHYIVGLSFMDLIMSQYEGDMQGRGQVKNGETTVIDIGDSDGATIVGTVTAQGQPLSHVQVVFISGSEQQMIFPGGLLSRVNTDADGNYRSVGLPKGSAKILVLRIDQSAAPRTLYRQEIEIPESGEIRIDINLQFAAVSGTVRDAETGQPIENAFLMLYSDRRGPDANPFELQPGAQDMGTNMARTSGDGRYTFDEVKFGRYIITCRVQKYAQQAVVIAVDTAPASDIDFAMPKEVGEIVGWVSDRATGQAIKGAIVTLIDQYGQMVMPAGSGPMGMFADQNGQFKIDSLAPGVYALMCGDPMGGVYAWTRIDGVLVQAGQITEQEIPLERGAEVVLSLVDPAGQPLLGAAWKLYNSRGISLMGQFTEIGNTIRTSIPPGEYTVKAERSGFNPVEFPFTIEEGQASFEAPLVARPL
ncbi:MAG: carboxypeptidase regulatory-like domain-containing protein [bacterium]